jgi:hypothetical protein
MRQRNPGPGGAGPRQTSMASGKRGANGQSGGSAASDGGAPGIGYQPLALRGVGAGAPAAAQERLDMAADKMVAHLLKPARFAESEAIQPRRPTAPLIALSVRPRNR